MPTLRQSLISHLTRLYPFYNRNLRDCDVVEVPVRPLSAIISEESIKSIRLIKIDVEGFEAEILQGGQEVLRSNTPDAILFELNEKLEYPIRDQPVIKILRDFRYRFFCIPRCVFQMHLEPFDPDSYNALIGHDFLAVREGETYENIAKLVRASV
mgnify:CR=1 FL=1